MQSELVKRIFNNGSAGVYGFGVTTLLQLGMVPVLICAWGIQRYGEWIVLTSICLLSFPAPWSAERLLHRGLAREVSLGPCSVNAICL